jgi:hypothetical protein
MKTTFGVLCLLLLAAAAAAFYFSSGLSLGIAAAVLALVAGVVYIVLEQLQFRAVSKKTDKVREELRLKCLALHKLSFKHMAGATEEQIEEMASFLTYGSALLMGPPHSFISYPSGYLLQRFEDGLCVINVGREKLENWIAAAGGTIQG